MAASLKGWNAALDDPAAAVAAMSGMFRDANVELAPAQLEATRQLMCSNRAQFVGKASPAQWDDTVSILTRVGVLPTGTKATSYYTYDYLPPDGSLRTCPLH